MIHAALSPCGATRCRTGVEVLHQSGGNAAKSEMEDANLSARQRRCRFELATPGADVEQNPSCVPSPPLRRYRSYHHLLHMGPSPEGSAVDTTDAQTQETALRGGEGPTSHGYDFRDLARYEALPPIRVELGHWSRARLSSMGRIDHVAVSDGRHGAEFRQILVRIRHMYALMRCCSTRSAGIDNHDGNEHRTG